MSRSKAIQLRIDMLDGDHITIVATNNSKPLAWDVIDKLERKLQHLSDIIYRLEWSGETEETEGGAA